MKEEDVKISENALILNDAIMHSAESYYNIVHYVIHQMLEKKFNKEELEMFHSTIGTATRNNIDIAVTSTRTMENI